VDADAARDFVKRFGRQMHMIIGGTFNPHEAKKFIDESATW